MKLGVTEKVVLLTRPFFRYIYIFTPVFKNFAISKHVYHKYNYTFSAPVSFLSAPKKTDSVIIIVVIEIFPLGLFYPRLDREYLCPELLSVLGQIDDGFNGLTQNPSFGQIGEF